MGNTKTQIVIKHENEYGENNQSVIQRTNTILTD